MIPRHRLPWHSFDALCSGAPDPATLSALGRREWAAFAAALAVYSLSAWRAAPMIPGGDEPHYLLAAKSIVEDGDIDVKDEFGRIAYGEFYPYLLDRHGGETDGRLHKPPGLGVPLLIHPAYAVAAARRGGRGRGAAGPRASAVSAPRGAPRRTASVRRPPPA